MPRRAVALLAVFAVLVACGGDDDDDAADGPAPIEGAPELIWEECGRVQCAALTVPLDYDDRDGETIDLELARRPADGDAIATLVTNPGGPGAAGVPLVDAAEAYFSPDVLERFDIVSWDPRGVGTSAAVDCVDDLDFVYAVDTSPDDEVEADAALAAAKTFVEGCTERTGDLLPYVSTASTVQDLDTIRAALGEEQLTYVGFSYGAYIGALYADRYPENVRAMVLDGAVDPALSFEQLSLDQAKGFDSALEAFLDDCASRDCDFGGDDPRVSYRLLMEAIDAEPLYAEVVGEDRELGPGEADLGVASLLYSGEAGWPSLERALVEAAQGDGTRLLASADRYTGREPDGEYSNQTEAFYAIGCIDGPAPQGAAFAAVAESVAQEAPFFGPATVWLSSPCAVWPVAAVGTPAPVRGSGAPPIVVLGTSNDPATPLRWAEAVAEQLESGVLVVFEGEGHTAYVRGNECIDDAVDTYLIELTAPEDGTRC